MYQYTRDLLIRGMPHEQPFIGQKILVIDGDAQELYISSLERR